MNVTFFTSSTSYTGNFLLFPVATIDVAQRQPQSTPQSTLLAVDVLRVSQQHTHQQGEVAPSTSHSLQLRPLRWQSRCQYLSLPCRHNHHRLPFHDLSELGALFTCIPSLPIRVLITTIFIPVATNCPDSQPKIPPSPNISPLPRKSLPVSPFSLQLISVIQVLLPLLSSV